MVRNFARFFKINKRPTRWAASSEMLPLHGILLDSLAHSRDALEQAGPNYDTWPRTPRELTRELLSRALKANSSKPQKSLGGLTR